MNGLAKFVRFVDWLNDLIGRGVAWLTVAMVLTTCLVVVLRYGFSMGWVWMQESYVWMHGLVFMIGAGYTLLHDGHVRVDIFYRPGSARYKAAVNLFGALVLVLPVIMLVIWTSYPYVVSSWEKLEGSREAGGLPGLYLLKTALLVFCVLVSLQALSMAARSLLVLTGREGLVAEAAPEEAA